MPRCEEQTNRFDGQIYVASIISTRTHILAPIKIGEIPVEPLRFEHLIFQAAVYPKKRIHSWKLAFTLPTLVIHLDCLPERTSENEFAEFVCKLLANEHIDGLFRRIPTTTFTRAMGSNRSDMIYDRSSGSKRSRSEERLVG